MKRRSEFDVARGLMLVLMTVQHLPTRFAQPTGQPLGYVSAAEGFVLVSAFMAGMVYTQRARQQNLQAMQQALVSRAFVVYLCQTALLVFLFTVIAALGLAVERPAVTDLMAFYLQQPLTALASGLALLYNPPLLDILPLYVLLLLASPFVLGHALRRGWGGWRAVLALSLALWFAAQFGLGAWLYDACFKPLGLAVSYREMGSFETFAWQLLWVLGLWMGSQVAQAGDGDAFPAPLFPRWWLLLAWAYALVFFVWRWTAGQLPQPEPDALMTVLFDKWSLGPLRLLNVLALLTLALQHGPALLARLPQRGPQRWLELLGTASLPVFCVHLVVVLLALAALGPAYPPRPLWIDVTLVVGTFALLTLVATVVRWHGRRKARRGSRLAQLALRWLQRRRQRRGLGQLHPNAER